MTDHDEPRAGGLGMTIDEARERYMPEFCLPSEVERWNRRHLPGTLLEDPAGTVVCVIQAPQPGGRAYVCNTVRTRYGGVYSDEPTARWVDDRWSVVREPQ